MPIPQTKVLLGSTILAGGGFTLKSPVVGDLAPTVTGSPSPSWMGSVADLNGDGIADYIMGLPGDDDKLLDAGRVFVTLGAQAAGSSNFVDAAAVTSIIIDGVNAGDMAGSSVGSISDLNGDGRAEILVGATGMENGALIDAGAGFVLWGMNTSGGIDLGDPMSGSGGGYAIKGQAAGDGAGVNILSVGDMNGDGKADVLIGAAGNDAGGTDAGAAYVVWGKSTNAAVLLNNVAAGVGGFKIIGEGSGDAVGRVIAALGDQNGDGKSEILIGVADDNSGGSNAGAVYVVDGKSTGTAVNLANVAAGIGGYKITGVAQDDAGAVVANAGDVNGDGRDDILIGAPRSDSAYVVFGKAGHANVDLNDVRNGIGGYHIVAEAAGDLDAMSVTGGVDLNRDGIEDLVIGASGNNEGGESAGAVYVVWGGGTGTVDLSLVAQGIGGAKIVGDAGSLTGASVTIGGDANGDGVADLIIGAPGLGEAAHVLFSPLSWQPELNIYGTNGDDLMGAGYGGTHKIDETANAVMGFAGNDTISGLGGNDSIEGGDGDDSVTGDAGADSLDGGTGADTLLGGDGNDTLIGGTGVDSLEGGLGDDTYFVDQGLDSVADVAGVDTVIASVSFALGAGVENLTLAGISLVGTGNDLNNTITGGGGHDTLDGGLGADRMVGGSGNDSYAVDDAGDVVVEGLNGGLDTVVSSINATLGAYVENLTLTGAARLGTGNGENNIITGTVGNDTLDGKAGIDRLVGGLGDDTYIVDATGDVVVEALGGGIDLVVSSAGSTQLAANVENLTLIGTAVSGLGNTLDNVIAGNDLGNSIDGGVGADTMAGGLGNDSYIVDNAGDVVIELAGGGTDTVTTAFNYTLTEGEIENLTLTGAAHVGTGNSGINTITGGAGADTLDGAGGADVLIGGAGDDTYVVDGTDTITETAGGGIDTMLASGSVTMAAEVEKLVLSGVGAVGTGTAGANTMTGTAGGQSLIGLDGNDTLDGGGGADTMNGGAGDDTYYVDDAGDVVIEAVGGGIDTIVSNSNVTAIAENIENIRLVGAAHIAVGNAGNNTLSGAAGDDDLDGGAGDDLLLGGDGNDDLASYSGADTLVGGSGDDHYDIAGGTVQIEDYLGHDTLDSSGATGNAHIDLSGDTDTVIEGNICHIAGGGSTSAPLDLQFLQDLTGSFGDDIATVRGLVPSIVAAIQAVQANSMFGVSSFVDKPVSPFGTTGEWVYAQHMALSSSVTALTATYNSIGIMNGVDGPEAQVEALMQLALHAGDVGFRPDSARFVVLFTDAPYHVAGDGIAGGITTANNGDAFFPGGGAFEDYPSIAQLQAALVAANIIPIFAVAGGFESTYSALATQLGRGTVVSLTANSSNIVAAITGGLTAATTTHIEDAVGGSGNDDIIGSTDNNHLTGNAGADTMAGGAGADTLVGGVGDDNLSGGTGNDDLRGDAGTDRAVFGGNRADYDITVTAGVVTIADLRAGGGDGTDTATGVDLFQFADGTLTLAQLSGVVATLTGVVDTDAAADSVAENSAVGTGVGIDVEGRDASGAAIAATFALVTDISGASVDATGPFQIDAATGVVTVRDATQLNFEAATSHTIFVQAVGSDGTIVVTSYAVAVTDVFEPVTILRVLTALADTFAATTDDHYGVTGLAGNDSITTLAGNDTVTGGVGNDTIGTGDGNDVIRVGGILDGYDAVNGGLGNDQIVATAANTAIGLSAVAGIEGISANGLTGVYIRGTTVADTLDFSASVLDGIGRIDGGSGNDSITGSAGNDVIAGSVGNDVINAGDGNDVITFSGTTGGSDAVTGGLGGDTISALAVNTVIGLASVAGVETITANGLAGVTIVGTTAANVFDFSGVTLDGIARISGGSGNDSISGSVGNDVIVGGVGNDVINAGDGDDTISFAGTADAYDVVNGGIGVDIISASVANTAIGLTSFTGIEAISANGLTGVYLRGTTAANVFDFAAVALDGITRIEGGSGNDSITGSIASDTISGGVGNDLLNGGDGDEVFTVTGIGDGYDVINGGIGVDRIDALAANTAIGLVSVSGVETISANGFAGVYIRGTTAANAFDFSGMVLDGVGRIEGGSGNDSIIGSAGTDVMVGGVGADLLTGGNGADVFDFNLSTESRTTTIDTITDFAKGADVIDLSGVDANTLLAGDQAFTFIGDVAFNKIAGELRAVTTTPGMTRIYGDLDGNGTTDFEVRLALNAGVAIVVDSFDFVL